MAQDGSSTSEKEDCVEVQSKMALPTIWIIIFCVLGAMILFFIALMFTLFGVSIAAKPGCIELYDLRNGIKHHINPSTLKDDPVLEGYSTVKLAGAFFGILGKEAMVPKIKIVHHPGTGRPLYGMMPYDLAMKVLGMSFRMDYIDLAKAKLTSAEFERLWKLEKAKTENSENFRVQKRMKDFADALPSTFKPKAKPNMGGGQSGRSF